MPTSLQCPTCAGPLPPPEDGEATLTCPYCGASSTLREAATSRPGPTTITVDVTNEARGCGALSIVIFVATIGLIVTGVLVFALQSPTDSPPVVPGRLVPSEEPLEARRFGSEGTGAGHFDDARHVAVDGDGRLYVAEYQNGRVQVFDTTGTFLTQWMVDTDLPLLDLIAGRDGTVYTTQGNKLRLYRGGTGDLIETRQSPRGVGFFSDLALAADGSLWAIGGPFHLLHMDPDGRELQRIDMREAVGGRAHPDEIAVSGTGDLYVADGVSNEIYRLDSTGRFVDRFGGRGDADSQFRTIQDLALDGRGRLYVSDPGRGIRVFSTDGRFLETFGGNAVVFGLAVDGRDGLYAAHRNDHQVVQYRLPE